MRSDRGNAVVEFVAVVPLVLIVGLAVLQIALYAHARSVVTTAASQAARAAAVSADPQGAARDVAQEILAGALGDVPLTGLTVQHESEAGLAVIAVELTARPNLSMLPVDVVINGRGRALTEGSP